MKRALATFVLVCAVLGVFSACTRGSIQPGGARLSLTRARAEVRRAGEDPRIVTGDTTLRAGDEVHVLTGEARMRLAGDNELWLRPGSDVTVGAEPRVNAGDVVAVVKGDGLTVRAAEAAAAISPGAARVSRDLGMAAGSYAGSLRLTTAGRTLAVPALREASVPAIGRLPVRPRPLIVRDTDSWDRHFLGLAVELTRDLQRRSDGFSAQLDSGEGRSPGFYRMLLPELDRLGFRSDLVDGSRVPGETLVGAAIAVRGDRGTLSSRWEEVFAFRDEGAAWGLVALDQAVRDVPGIRQVLTDAVGRFVSSTADGQQAASPLAGGPEVSAPASSAPTAPAGSVPSTVAPPAPQPVPRPAPPTAPAPVTVPPVTPEPGEQGPVEVILDGATDTVDDLVGGLLG